MILRGHVTNENRYISITKVPIDTKLGSMVIYLDGLLSIKSLERLITWFVRSSEKLKPLYLKYHCASGLQTLQDGDLP